MANRLFVLGLSLLVVGCEARTPPAETTEPAKAVAPVTPPPALPTPDLDALKAQVGADGALEILTFERDGQTTAEGAVSGYKAPVYAVPVAAAQTLSVDFKSPSANLYVNVVDASDASGAAVFRGEVDGATASLKAAVDTTYLIKPYQPRAMARRGERGTFTLTIGRK